MSGLSELLSPLRSDQMIQEPIQEAMKLRQPRPVAKPRRRLIGGREILLLLVAFSLLALAPSIAQVMGGISSSGPQRQSSFGMAERAETNFAGSAFYFQEQDYIVPPTSEAIAAAQGSNAALFEIPPSAALAPMDDPAAPYDVNGVGGIARPFVVNGASPDYGRALKCLTDAIYYEAASESDSGQRAVAQVILNRMRHPTYPNNVCGVIYQGSERHTGCQLSYLRRFNGAHTIQFPLGTRPPRCDERACGICPRTSWHGDALSHRQYLPLLGTKPAFPWHHRCAPVLSLERQCRASFCILPQLCRE